MSLVARVRRTLERRRLLRGSPHVVVGCSSGPDSTALLHVLHELAPAFHLRLTAACVDHGLRPEAAAEAELVRRHADALGVPFHHCRVHVERRSKKGLQAAARTVRYEALHALASRAGASAIAVGHTRDDQAETVLARLLRTPSVGALSAIQPARRDGVVRPLIDCERQQVLDFVEQRGLEVTSDPSNRDLAYTRARVRHEILPVLTAENPRLVEGLARLADDARACEELLEGLAPRLDLGAPGAQARLREQPAAVRRYLLRQWVRQYTGSDASLRSVELLEAGAEVLLEGDRAAAWSPRGALFVGPRVKRTRGR